MRCALRRQIGLLTALNVLYVQSNAIEEISPQIGLLLNLMTLALHDNRLQYLPKELGRCSELQARPVRDGYSVDATASSFHEASGCAPCN